MTTPSSARFVNVGERTNVTGSAAFKKLILAGDYTKAVEVARQQVENGAQIIDVNMDEGLLEPVHAMTTFLKLIAAEPEIDQFVLALDELLGDVERSTSWGTGIEQQSLGFVTYTLMGWLTCIESSISNALPRGQFAKFDTTALLRGDQKSRYESYQLARQAGLLSVNEMRAREEMPPVPDGDGYLQPLNFAPLGFDPATVATPKTVTEGTTEGTDPAPTPAPKKPAGLEPAPPGIGARIISRYRQEHT